MATRTPSRDPVGAPGQSGPRSCVGAQVRPNPNPPCLGDSTTPERTGAPASSKSFFTAQYDLTLKPPPLSRMDSLTTGLWGATQAPETTRDRVYPAEAYDDGRRGRVTGTR
ncbi:hypothetical protein XA68_11204 [Ophiocordyceps unilateralis]|uniref:Uncharacterized protein n=1 Tax=Ophiocordyceps unilateralis TaxID=268505 RepID=A0A2A9NXJ2_OPHUN|nr:hypothetical protein XA68_11204 [Ophiocordyceps unilateralis]